MKSMPVLVLTVSLMSLPDTLLAKNESQNCPYEFLVSDSVRGFTESRPSGNAIFTENQRSDRNSQENPSAGNIDYGGPELDFSQSGNVEPNF